MHIENLNTIEALAEFLQGNQPVAFSKTSGGRFNTKPSPV